MRAVMSVDGPNRGNRSETQSASDAAPTTRKKRNVSFDIAGA
jgi:hypothetical protein